MKIKIFHFVLIIFLLGILGGTFSLNKLSENNRLEITSPMLDYEYKKNIILSSKNRKYKLENLRQLVGPKELEEFIIENNKNPDIYSPTKNNIENGIYRANLHMHSINSDGAASVEFLLNQAQAYAENKLEGKDFYLAITDHNTVLGAKEIIEVLQKNPNKYKNIRIVAGIEIYTAYQNSAVAKKPVEIHVLTWCINPYDKFLNKEFYKKNLNDKWNRILPDRDFDKVIDFMSDYGIVGIAHPARHLGSLEDKENYIKELITKYKKANKNHVLFMEGYYQSYSYFFKPFGKKEKDFLNYINKEAHKSGINLTGSTDVHGYNIFNK